MPETTNQMTAPPPAVPVSAPRIHFAYLDSLRGLAALWVLLSHVWEAEIGYEVHPGLYGALTNWMQYPHFAVDVFIVLSGFCLMLPVARSGVLQGGAGRFYLRRVQRILPPFYICLLISTCIYVTALKVGRVAHTPLSAKMLLANFLLLQDAFPQYNHITPALWSVAVECKIYLLFPLLAWLYFRYKSYAILAFGALVGYGLTAVLHLLYPHIGLNLTCPWYVFLFAFGVCAGAAVSNKNLSAAIGGWQVQGAFWSALLLIVLLRYSLNDLQAWLPAVDALAGACTASLLVLVHQQYLTQRRNPLLTFLSWPPLVKTGLFAYSIYLMHGPCLGLITAVIKRLVSSGLPERTGKLLVFFPGVPLTIAVCYVFYLTCERPFIHRRIVERDPS